jgi:CheY-like chemotaxis protein
MLATQEGIVAQDAPVRTVLAGIDDLFFLSKVQSTAKAAGIRLVEAPSAAKLEAALNAETPDLILLDLISAACRPIEFLLKIKTAAGRKTIPVVGFLSHVQVELAQEAREAGCDAVLPRSKFSAGLARILRDFPSGGTVGGS